MYKPERKEANGTTSTLVIALVSNEIMFNCIEIFKICHHISHECILYMYTYVGCRFVGGQQI